MLWRIKESCGFTRGQQLKKGVSLTSDLACSNHSSVDVVLTAKILNRSREKKAPRKRLIRIRIAGI